LTNILAELVGGLTLGRARVEVSTAQLFSNTIYTSAKLDYQGTGFRFAAPLHLKLLNKRCEGDPELAAIVSHIGSSGYCVWNTECSVKQLQ
jgi:hypothetical protein